MNVSRHRSPEEVFEDHLRLRLEGNIEEDLRRNYSEDVVLLTVNSNAKGHDALRVSAARLSDQLPEAEFRVVAKQVAETGRLRRISGSRISSTSSNTASMKLRR